MSDRRKLQSAVAYIAGKTSPGKVKLFKLLYLADFTAKARLGQSISGDVYENFDMGPVPVTLWHDFNAVIKDCVTITSVDTGVIPEQQMRRRPGFTIDLSDDERQILDEVIERFGAMSGNALRDYTHKTLPYRATQRGDSIPYGLAAYLNYERPSRADLDELLSDETFVAQLRTALHRHDRVTQ